MVWSASKNLVSFRWKRNRLYRGHGCPLRWSSMGPKYVRKQTVVGRKFYTIARSSPWSKSMQPIEWWNPVCPNLAYNRNVVCLKLLFCNLLRFSGTNPLCWWWWRPFVASRLPLVLKNRLGNKDFRLDPENVSGSSSLSAIPVRWSMMMAGELELAIVRSPGMGASV